MLSGYEWKNWTLKWNKKRHDNREIHAINFEIASEKWGSILLGLKKKEKKKPLSTNTTGN